MAGSQEKTIEEEVYLVYKKLGETPLETIQRFKKDNKDLNITYAGRLDPMAEGLLILLSGEKVLDKNKYTDLPKTYEFEVLWGLSTDTLDVLGLVDKESKDLEVKEDQLQNYLKDSIGRFEQEYPDYSSKPVQGKPLFMWAREGRLNEVEIPKHEVEIFEAEYLSRREISKEDLLNDITLKVSLVKGDFRQREILEKWNEVIKESGDKFNIDKIRLKVSSGFYVRQFVKDLAKSFGGSAVTFHIKRTQIGDFSLA